MCKFESQKSMYEKGRTHRGNDNLCTSSQKSLDNLDSNRSLPHTGHESVLVLERNSRGGDLLENIEVKRAARRVQSESAPAQTPFN